METTTNAKVGKKICKICGDVATAFNFSGLSCETCKIFFRRSHNKKLKCRFGGNCQIDTILTRKACAACRLKKCFAIGMKMKSKVPSVLAGGTSTSLRKLLESGREGELSESICECQLKRLEESSKRRRLELTEYEQQLVDEVATAMEVFPDESTLPVASMVTNFKQAFNLPGNYARRIVKFCKKFEAFKCLPQEDQFVILKAFYFELCSVRFPYYFDETRKCMRLIANEEANQIMLIPFELYLNSQFHDLAIVNAEYMMTLRREMNNDATVRNLLIAQFLFKPRENASAPEFLNYHHCLYRRLLHRYFEHHFNSITKAKSKFLTLMKQISEENLLQVRSNLVTVLSTVELVNPMALVIKEVFNIKQ